MTMYAYVTVLYGNNIYLTGALVLGYSLMKTKTMYDRVILVTPDVSEVYRSYLKVYYTRIIDIEYVKVDNQLFLKDTRFRDVFTKLECLSLVEYQKIILLDLDMVIVKNFDHVFKLKPPAACLKHYSVPYGRRIPEKYICDTTNTTPKLTGSINAGLILLEPDLDEWLDIKNDISRSGQIQKYKYPEQDYLSLRYCDRWTSITFNYNYQFGLTKRVQRENYSADKIYVIHYSSSYKPWNLLKSDQTFVTDDELKFSIKHKKYYDLWTNIYAKIKSDFKQKSIDLPY